MSKEIEKYVLVLHVQGPNFVSKEQLEVDDIVDTQPKQVNINGFVYDRYGDDDNFIDIKPDLIVMRSIRSVCKETKVVGPSRGTTMGPRVGPAAIDKEDRDGSR